MATPEEAEVRRKLVDALGEEAVAAAEATNELRRFSATTKSIAARQKRLGDDLINTGIPLVKYTGSIVKTLSSYNANIKIAEQQYRTNQQKLSALEAKRQAQLDKLTVATTATEKRKAALKLQATLDSIEATKLDTTRQKENIKAFEKTKFREVMQQTAKSMKETGQAFTKLTKSLNNTQKDFGISIGGAATLKANTMVDTVKDAVAILEKLDLGAAVSAAGDIASGFGGAINQLFTGGGITKAADAVGGGFDKANTPIKGPLLDQLLLPSERLAGIKALQEQFGVMNVTLGTSLAQTAKNYGVSVEQLVQSRRIFATIARGDLSQVDTLQNRFFDRFKQAGMERKVALEAITKYADLIARNGTRFADSFARAAADAKKIGIDLGKVEQVGDNIIDNFEGFLESQAELGAMGFGFDTSRLAEIAITGDTGALQDELRSQLAMTGKDINNLNRAERLSLEKAFGMDIGELQRMAGGTPQMTAEDIATDTNTKLTQLLILAQIAGPLLGPLGNIAASLATPTGLAIATIGGIGLWLKNRFDEDQDKKARESAAKREEGLSVLATGNEVEARKLLAEAVEIGLPYYVGREFERQRGIKEIDTLIENYKVQSMGAGPLASSLKENSPFYQPYKIVTPEVIQSQQNPFAVKRAQGGVINGPGTGTSDSIPTMLSNGEYVLPASLVGRIGVKNLDMLRSMSGSSDYLDLLQALLKGDFKGALRYGKNIAQANLIETIIKNMLKAGSLEASLVATAGTDVYDTYQANKNKPYPTYFSTTKPGELPSWVINARERGLKMRDGGLVGKLKSMAMNKGMAFLSNRIPGLSTAMNIFSDYKTGGIGGALKSASGTNLGKMIGGMLGSAIPIPGVGTAIGSLMGSKVGKLVGGLFGRRKQPISQQLMGALPDMAGFAGNLMGRIPGMERFNPEGLMRGMAERPQAQAAVQTVVDTTGIEQKLNNFVNALNNMNIVMDGAKVGKVLVNVTDAANTVGVFRPATRATL